MVHRNLGGRGASTLGGGADPGGRRGGGRRLHRRHGAAGAPPRARGGVAAALHDRRLHPGADAVGARAAGRRDPAAARVARSTPASRRCAWCRCWSSRSCPRSRRDPARPARAPHDLPVDLGAATALGPAAGRRRPRPDRVPLFPRVDVAKPRSSSRAEQAPMAPPAATRPAPAPADTRAQIAIEEFAARQAGRRHRPSRRAGAKLEEAGAAAGRPRRGRSRASSSPASASAYPPEQLLGRRIVVVANLKPAKLMGVESRGMLLAASVSGDPSCCPPDGEVPPGTGVS